jgi:hypothetical protein
MDPCQEFQGLDVEEVPGCDPCVGIIPCIGIGCSKLGFPPVGKVADEKALLANAPNKKNGVEPTNILCKGGP